MSPLNSQQIEKELAELWTTLPGDQEKELGLQRVYTTNLVAYAEDPADGFRVERTLHHLAEIHPGRFLLIRPGEKRRRKPIPRCGISFQGIVFFFKGVKKRSAVNSCNWSPPRKRWIICTDWLSPFSCPIYRWNSGGRGNFLSVILFSIRWPGKSPGFGWIRRDSRRSS